MLHIRAVLTAPMSTPSFPDVDTLLLPCEPILKATLSLPCAAYPFYQSGYREEPYFIFLPIYRCAYCAILTITNLFF